MLWRNKILVRAHPPFSSLRYLHITLHHAVPSLKLHSLCWKLSRIWHLACFFHDSDIYVAYQVVADEESMSGSLMTKAVDCSLRSVLLENGWRCVGNGCMVNCSFATSEEKNDVFAINLVVQADTNDGFAFLVSPDVVRFNRFKILPMLIIGLSRLLPAEEDFGNMQDIWSLKHGLILPDDFFVQIQFLDKARETNQWFPSTFILQSPGLIPAPQSIRTSKVAFALVSFMKTIEGWDFFDGGNLRIKGACRLGISSELPVWSKATDFTGNHILAVNEGTGIPTTEDGKILFFKSLLSTQDFRTPKPSPVFVSGIGSSEDIFKPSNARSPWKDIQSHAYVQFQDAVSINTVTKFRPRFMRHKHSKKTILSGRTANKSCLPSDDRAQKTDHHKNKPKPDNGAASKGNATTEKHELLKESEMNISKTSINTKRLQDFLVRVPLDNLSKSRKGTEERLKKTEVTAATKEIEKGARKKQKMQHPELPNDMDVEVIEQAILKKQTKPRGEDRDEKLQKKQTKEQINPSDIVKKVLDCRARARLGSLTVPELKSFLALRKAKVGGKKEDLVQRILSMLA